MKTEIVRFEVVPYNLKDWLILPVPKDESVKLGSRGQISVTIELNGKTFNTVLEPDGRWSHWLRVTNIMQQEAKIKADETISVIITKNETWPEPTIPKDLKDALESASQAVWDKWNDITPMARWEWVRWMNATPSEETRAIRIEKTISKLSGKHRRPCCFNLAACTEPYVAKSGRLIEVG